MRWRATPLVLALAAWVAGSALGSKPVHGRPAQPAFILTAAHGAQFFPVLNGTKPIFILALGSDARPGQPVAKERSDSIHIIGVNPAKHLASVLGFPRDSYVTIPGHGKGKITSAMALGGPQLTIRTIENLTHIRIGFFLLTSFPGLVKMVDDIGGLTVYVPYPMHDHFSGADFSKGVHHMSGRQALSFARDRHDVPGGDLGRSQDQGRLFLAALSAFHKDFQKDPGTTLTWMGAGIRNIQTNLSIPQILKLAFTASRVPPTKNCNMVVPGTSTTIGGASVVILSRQAPAIYADMRRDGLIQNPRCSFQGA